MTSNATQAVTTLQKCSGEVDRLADAINTAISWIPAPLRGLLGDVLQKWDDFCAEVQRLFDLFADVTSYGLGDPGALRDAADSWKRSVTDLLKAAGEAVSRPELRATESWEGPTADAYLVAIEKQQTEVEDMRETIDMMADALTGHADSIENFWGNILNGFVNFLLSLAGAVVSALALVPPITPLGVIGLIVSVAGAVKSVWDLLATEISDLEQFSEDARALGEDVVERFSSPPPSLVA